MRVYAPFYSPREVLGVRAKAMADNGRRASAGLRLGSSPGQTQGGRESRQAGPAWR
jgi:hypothetical protein